MKKTYWARFFEDEGGDGFTVDVPDLPGCVTEGDTWEDAVYMVRDAMRGWLRLSLEEGEPLPAARGREAVAAAETFEGAGQPRLEQIAVDLGDSSISAIPEGVMSDMARLSMARGVPVGALLTLAAREYLARENA